MTAASAPQFASEPPSAVTVPPLGQPGEEQRDDPRLATSLPGAVVTNGVTLDCLVRDVSNGGAKVEIDQKHALGQTFDLIVPQLQTVFRCELRWRYSRAVGVKFLSSDPLKVGDHEETRDELLAEIAQLKATIADLTQQLADAQKPKARIARKGPSAGKTSADKPEKRTSRPARAAAKKSDEPSCV